MLVDMEGSEGRSSWLRVAVKSLATLAIHEYSSNSICGPVWHAMESIGASGVIPECNAARNGGHGAPWAAGNR